jgi:hypothetical protein
MKYEDKEFIALIISCALFMCAAYSHSIWNWPTNQHLFYAGCIWLVVACISGLCSCYLQTKK